MKKINISLSSIEPLIQKISNLTKIQRILLCVGSVVLIIGVFGYFLYWPQLKQQGQLDKDISTEIVKLKQTKANADEFAKYQKLMEEKKAQFTIVSKQLPQTDEVPTLLKNISQAGIEAGLNFLLFMPEAEKIKNFYAEIPVKMELSGSYHDLGIFFDRMAGMSRIVNIKSFGMISSAQTAKKGKAAVSKTATGQTASSEISISCMAETYKFVQTPPVEAKDEAAKADETGKKGKKGKKRK